MKPKVAIIGVKGLPAFGGAARSNEQVIERLKSKYDFTVYLVDTHTNMNNIPDGISVILFNGNSSKRFNTLLYYLKSVTHSLFFGKYDIIHVNHLSFGFFVPFLKLKYKVIGTDHGLSWLFQTTKGNKWNRLDILYFHLNKYVFIKFVDLLITVSGAYLDYYKKYKNEVLVINNGIEVDEVNYQNKIVKDYILFSAGRIIELKGCHLLLNALKINGYTGKVKIIGNLEHSIKYKKYIIELSEGLNVEFIGLIKEKYILFKYLKEAKLFVFPSLSEGMSNMLLEVVSQNTPVIASDIPENKQIFNDDEMLFFKSGNSEDLAVKINKALSDYHSMKVMSKKAFEHLNKNYSIAEISKKYDNAYKYVINQRH